MATESGLSTALSGLRQLGVLPGAGDTFAGMLDAVRADASAQIRAEVDAFTESRNPELLPDLEDLLSKHGDTVRRLLADQPADYAFVAGYAARQAARKFPLDADLRALRWVGQVLADAVRDAAVATAPSEAELRRVVAAGRAFVVEYTGLCAGIATREYVAETRRLAEIEGDRRNELLTLLLSGYDESDARAAALLRRSGYLQQRQVYCVAVVRTVNPAEMEDPARVMRIEETLRDLLRDTRARLLVGVHKDMLVAVLSATQRLSGWTRPHTVVSELVQTPLRLMGNAVLIGVSTDKPSTSHIPVALSEAEQALNLASVANRVVDFFNLGFVDLVVERAREELDIAPPGWLGRFQSVDRKNKLRATLLAYADNDMNVLQTAKALAVHPNTLYARFEKVEAVTQRDPRRFHDLTELLFVLRVHAENR